MAFTRPDLLWLLLVVPGLLIIGLGGGMLRRRDIARFGAPELFCALARSTSTNRRLLRRVAFHTGVVFIIIALAGPRFGTQTEIVTRKGIDIVIAIDTSYSMLAEDVKPNRMLQAKYEIGRLIDGLKGDRVALLAFSGEAIVQCPLTTDYGAARTFLDAIDAGIVPYPGTNIGSAIDWTLTLFSKSRESGGGSQALIIVTDGESISGDPITTAKRAAAQGLRIYTIGVGTPEGEIIPLRTDDGQLEDYKRDADGNVVTTRLDETTLRTIASAGGGSYLRAEHGGVDIEDMLAELGGMHQSELTERTVARLKERYQLPLGLGLLLLFVWFLLGDRRKHYPHPTTAHNSVISALAIIITGLTLSSPANADEAASLNRKGIESYQKGDYEASVSQFTQALIERPDSPELIFNRGTALGMTGSTPEATEELSRAASSFIAPSRAAAAHFNAGNTHFAAGDLTKAVEEYKHAVKLDQSSRDIRHNLELALSRLKQQQQQDQQQKQNQQKQNSKQEQSPQQNQQQKQEQRQQDKPSPQSRQDQSLTPEQANQLLDALENDEQRALELRKLMMQQSVRQGNDW